MWLFYFGTRIIVIQTKYMKGNLEEQSLNTNGNLHENSRQSTVLWILHNTEVIIKSMFACIVSGRLVTTDFKQVDTCKFMTEIILPPGEGEFKHLCVFLTGQAPLPDLSAAALYISWGPDFSTFNFVGHLTNQKPSAIFKLTLPQIETQSLARLGVSIEPLQNLTQQLTTNANKKNETQQTTALKVAKNLVNYASSFTTGGNNQSIPLSVIEKWYTSLQEKLKYDPNFIDKIN